MLDRTPLPCCVWTIYTWTHSRSKTSRHCMEIIFPEPLVSNAVCYTEDFIHASHVLLPGRIAGQDGKTKFTIENASRTRIVLADTWVISALLCSSDHWISFALEKSTSWGPSKTSRLRETPSYRSSLVHRPGRFMPACVPSVVACVSELCRVF